MDEARPGLRPGEHGDEIVIPGEDEPFRILSWVPPRLILAHGEEVRSFFLAAGQDGVWVGSRGDARFVERPSRRRALEASRTPEGHPLRIERELTPVRVADGEKAYRERRTTRNRRTIHPKGQGKLPSCPRW